jgi:hypothetical protein
LWIGLANRQSQSPIGNLNRQSTISKSAVANPQSAIDSLCLFPVTLLTFFLDALLAHLLLSVRGRIDLLSMRLYDAGDARVRRL